MRLCLCLCLCMLFRWPRRRFEASFQESGERAGSESNKVVPEEGDESVERFDEDAEQACGAVWQDEGNEGREDVVGELDAICLNRSACISKQARCVV